MAVNETPYGHSYGSSQAGPVTVIPGTSAAYKQAVSGASSQAPVQVMAPDRQPLPRLTSENSRIMGGAGHRPAALSKLGQSVDVQFSTPEIRNPLLSLINFYLPYDRKTLNQWIRYYDRFQPLVGNAMDMHGDFPISDFQFTNVPDPEMLEVFEECKEQCDMLQWMFDASREYELLSEVFTFWNWNDDLGMWDDHVFLNPDLLDYQEPLWGKKGDAVYTYEPPEELKRLAQDQDPRSQQIIDMLDPVVIEAVMSGQRIPLDPNNVTSLIRRASPYEMRGTPILLRCLKELMYEDKIREVQYAIADQQITPIQLWKVGDTAAGYMPTTEDLNDFRRLIIEGAHDPLFQIVTHSAIAVDLIGFTGKLLPVIPEYEWVENRVLTALFTNKAQTTGEAGGLQAGAVIGLKVLQGRYQSKRDKLVKIVQNRLLRRVAEEHGFYHIPKADSAHHIRTSKRRRLVIPDIEWNFKLDLTNDQQKLTFLQSMRTRMEIPVKTLAEIFDLDYDTIRKELEDEENTVFDPVYQSQRTEAGKAVGQAGGMPGGGGGDLGLGGLDLGGVGEEVGEVDEGDVETPENAGTEGTVGGGESLEGEAAGIGGGGPAAA